MKWIGKNGFNFSRTASGYPSLAGTGSQSGSATGTSSTGSTKKETSYKVDENTIYSITPQGKMTIDISVDELDIVKIRTGRKVNVTLDALSGQSFEGVISSVSSTGTYSTGNTKYAVTVTLNRTDKMMAGMNALVSLDTGSDEEFLTIPVAALVEKNGRTYVYTSYDEKEDTLGGLKEVTTGRSDGVDVEISGLAATDKVYYKYADSIEYSF